MSFSQNRKSKRAAARVLDVGNCDPDHAQLRRLVSSLGADMERVMFVDEAMAKLASNHYDLVLVNRLIFADRSEGILLIERIQADASLRATPVMMVSNLAEAQKAAMAAGARRGFGKAALHDPKTLEMLKPFLIRPEL